MGQKCCTRSSRSAVAIWADTERSRHAGPQPGEESDEIRVDKVLDIRRQLAEGTYSIADRLDVVVERIIEDFR